MAAPAAFKHQDAFRCSVCLEPLNDPVSIPCGHNYCMSCISGCWDQGDQKGVYSCPQCRESFSPRPVLRKNTMLADLADEMKKTSIQAAPSVAWARPGDSIFHIPVPAAAKRTEKQNQLGEMDARFQRRIQETEEDFQNLRETSPYKNLSEEALAFSDGIFAELHQCIERKHSEVKELISAQQKTARFHTFTNCPVVNYSPILIGTPTKPFEDLRQSLYTLRQKVEDVCGTDIRSAVSGGREPRRQDLVKYSFPLTLDISSSCKLIKLSYNNTQASTGRDDNAVFLPERVLRHYTNSFDVNQVLCRQSLSGCCYWEIEWSHDTKGIDIGVAYEDMKRKGWDSRLGFNEKSWSLSCSPRKACSFWHNKNKTFIPVVPAKRIGMYLNYEAGILSFYNVIGDRMTLIHTLHTTFTGPLYPGFWLDHEAFVRICTEIL